MLECWQGGGEDGEGRRIRKNMEYRVPSGTARIEI